MSPGTQPMAAAAAPASPTEAALTVPHPGDGECDGTLELQVVGGDRLVGVCSDCDEEFTFRLLRPKAEEEGDDAGEREERPRRRSFDRPGGDDRAPPSRPCRQCGGQLSFETADDGTLTGRCASCGNTFSLAPRRPGGPRGGGGGFRGRGGRDFGGGGGGGYRGRPPGRRFERRRDDDDGDDRRRRRFRRDD
jgi:hypothetical protein